jgi:2-C-methyl-D-erythritol 4-phosphate cytidylyltransferase
LRQGSDSPNPVESSASRIVGAIIVAAGSSRRMGGVDKLFISVNGRPLIAWAIDVFQNCQSIQQIVLVVSEQRLEEARNLAQKEGWTKLKQICVGGERRQDSVAQGLKKLSKCDWVVIHDGARPCLTGELIERGLVEATETGAAIAAVPVKDTIKVVSEGLVQETPNRQKLWIVQTPQVFRFDTIERAYHQAIDEVTDDASLVEKLGEKVRVCMGSYDNIKVTTPEDLEWATLLLRNRVNHTRQKI